MTWWFWMIWRPSYPGGPEEYNGVGPFRMTIAEAFNAEFRMKTQYLTQDIYRWVWSPEHGWVYDDRNDRQFLAAA
jgi:hypothetical protein